MGRNKLILRTETEVKLQGTPQQYYIMRVYGYNEEGLRYLKKVHTSKNYNYLKKVSKKY